MCCTNLYVCTNVYIHACILFVHVSMYICMYCPWTQAFIWKLLKHAFVCMSCLRNMSTQSHHLVKRWHKNAKCIHAHVNLVQGYEESLLTCTFLCMYAHIYTIVHITHGGYFQSIYTVQSTDVASFISAHIHVHTYHGYANLTKCTCRLQT